MQLPRLFWDLRLGRTLRAGNVVYGNQTWKVHPGNGGFNGKNWENHSQLGGLPRQEVQVYYAQTHFSSSLLAQVESPDVDTSEKALLGIWRTQGHPLPMNVKGLQQPEVFEWLEC